MAEQKKTYNICMGSGCHEMCVLTSVVEDGKIVRTERTYAPDSGVPITGICQKGIEYAKFPYMQPPKRLLYPLKRVGERGEGKFERISWDQALDEIAAKILDVKAKYGPQAVMVDNFASSYPDAFFGLDFGLIYRFVHEFGASIMPWYPVDMGVAWASVFQMGTLFGYWAFDPRRLANAKYIVLWGSNALGWNRAGYTTKYYMDAKENGAKVVDIGLFFDSSAAMADQFVPIKAGTDIYLAQSMLNVLFRDHLYDEDFISKHTNLGFLVRKDNGQLLRASEVIEGADPSAYVVIDRRTSKPVAVAPHQDPGDLKPELFAELNVQGIPCSTGLVELRKSVEPWTPEAQAKITGVPAEVAEGIIHEYVETENSLLYMYEGLRYANAGPACRAIMDIPAVAGKIGKGVGGLAICGNMGTYPVALNELPFYFAGDPSKTTAKFPFSMADALEAGFPYKVLLNLMGNPVQAWPNLHMWKETVLPKFDLIVTREVRMSETALWSDYVLPDTPTLERLEVTVKEEHAILLEPAIPPQGEAKSGPDFWREFGKRLGMGDTFDKTAEEWIALRLQTQDPAIATLNPPLTMERLKKEKIVRLNLPKEPYDVWAKLDFPTPSGRMEVYTEGLAKVNQAVPHYLEPVIRGPRAQKYPFHLFVGRHRFFVQSQFSEFDDLRRLAGDKPFIRMNAQDAIEHGFVAGDKVEVFNDGGSFRVPVELSAAIPRGIVFAYLAYSSKEWEGDPPQALMSPSGTPEVMDDVMRATADYFKPMMGFPETLDIDHHLLGGWETIFDNVCDVRKA